jgi:DNA repair exonuclease SbcCD nuclease subunit
MNILVTSDLHLSAKARDRYRFDACERLRKRMEKKPPQALLIAGDLTEEKDRHPAQLVNDVVRTMHEFAQIAPLLILKANHDYRDEAHPFFAFLSRVPNVHWIDDISNASMLPKQFRAPFAGCLFLPHTHSPKRDWKGWVDKTTYRFIFAHQLFSGAGSESGKRLTGVDPDLIPNKQCVLAGDVHTPHKVTDHIEYIGAPYHVDFGDNYQARYIEILANSSSRQLISKTTADWPQKRLIALDDVSELKEHQGTHPGDIVLVRVQVSSMERWPKVRERVARWGDANNVHVHRVEPVMAHKAARRHVKVKNSTRADDLDTLRQFSKRHGIDEHTQTMGQEIIGDVK